MSTYSPIASQTLGSAASEVTFSSIPQGYTDLIVVMNLGAASSGVDIFCQVNADTGSNYSNTRLTGDGTTASSSRNTSASNMRFSDGGSPQTTANSITTAHFMNYSNATTYKTVLNRASNGNRGTDAYVNLWRSTSAITSINIYLSSGNITSGSTFSLYGIQVGDKSQKAQGGNIVTSDGTYVYHTFTSSGSFTPSQALTVDYLVVAGGGGGGCQRGAGGGAGGYRTSIGGSALSLSLGKSYPVIIGAGGNGGINSGNVIAGQGSDSIFSTITSSGGGYGKANFQSGNPGGAGIAGGSGGGGGAAYSGGNAPGGAGNTPSTSPSQGNNGGSGADAASPAGGGGGGAGAVGGNAPSAQGGAGGNGTANSISGTSITYAGGGGGGAFSGSGGTGGTGGGGAGSASTSGAAGTVNLGAGGGGGANTSDGGNGGSGIVIIRYAL